MKLAYLGPIGSYTWQAATRYYPGETLVFCQNFRQIFAAVQTGRSEYGLLPIENLIQGVINENLDLLLESNLKIQAEHILPIHHALLIKPGTTAIQQILSHPQALAQCSRFLQLHYPEARQVVCDSTSDAIDQVAQGKFSDCAAIGFAAAGEEQGLVVMATRIEDSADNATRFWLIGRSLNSLPAHNKCSLAFAFAKDRPGTLYDALGLFAQSGINLSLIISRPAKTQLGSYVFYLDALTNLNAVPTSSILAQLNQLTLQCVILGSYQAAHSPLEFKDA